MPRSAAAAALSSLVLLGGLAGCGGDDQEPSAGPTQSTESARPSPDASTTATSSASPSASSGASGGASGAPFPADLSPDEAEPSGNGLTVTDVRVGRQDGFDRVVFELAGTGEPGWFAEYVDVPRSEGSGDLIDIEGSVFLQVVLRGLGLPDDTGVEPFGPTSVAGTGEVAEVVPRGVFEGEQLAMIGLDGARRPFRVFSLDDPARVVVDVQR